MQIDSAVLYIFRKELAAKIIPAQVRQIHQIDNRIIDIELFRSYEKPIHLIFDTYRPFNLHHRKPKKGHRIYALSKRFA